MSGRRRGEEERGRKAECWLLPPGPAAVTLLGLRSVRTGAGALMKSLQSGRGHSVLH